MFCYCTPLNKDFWLNIFSSPGKNNCMCLFIAACNWTGNTIATPQRFFLNSYWNESRSIQKRKTRERKYILAHASAEDIPVRSLFLFLPSSLQLRDAGVGISFSSEYLSLQPAGYAEVGLLLSYSLLYDHFFGTSTCIYVGLLYFRLCLAITG